MILHHLAYHPLAWIVVAVGIVVAVAILADIWAARMWRRLEPVETCETAQDGPVGVVPGREESISPDDVEDDDPHMRAMVAEAWNTGQMVFGEVDEEGRLTMTTHDIPASDPAPADAPMGGPSAAGGRLEVLVDYTNHRGERSTRRVVPMAETLRFAEVGWHPGEQWILDVVDLDRGAVRTFAMKDIHSWVPPCRGPEETQ